MRKIIGLCVWFLLALLVAALLSFLVALPFQMLWNYAITHAFGARELGFWHAWCLMVFVAFYVQGSGKRS
jgi:hypothetical protein